MDPGMHAMLEMHRHFQRQQIDMVRRTHGQTAIMVIQTQQGLTVTQQSLAAVVESVQLGQNALKEEPDEDPASASRSGASWNRRSSSSSGTSFRAWRGLPGAARQVFGADGAAWLGQGRADRDLRAGRGATSTG